jgi:hypothetical protein
VTETIGYRPRPAGIIEFQQRADLRVPRSSRPEEAGLEAQLPPPPERSSQIGRIEHLIGIGRSRVMKAKMTRERGFIWLPSRRYRLSLFVASGRANAAAGLCAVADAAFR